MADQDLSAMRGDTIIWDITCVLADGTTPLDLTGALAWLSIKRSVRDTDPLIQKSIGAGIVVAAPASGVATVTLAPADTAPLAPGPYVYDVQLKDSAGRIATVASGVLSLTGDVTLVTA